MSDVVEFAKAILHGDEKHRDWLMQSANDWARYGSLMCHSQEDGDCDWRHCPRLRDSEPVVTGRHCPLASEVGIE